MTDLSQGDISEAEAMDMIRGAVARQQERYEAALTVCQNCEGVGWHTEIEVVVHGVTMAAGGDCPVCHGVGKVMRSHPEPLAEFEAFGPVFP